MDPVRRRFLASLGCAVLIVHWWIGLERLTWDANDVAAFAVVLGICWLIAWRAWPAAEITWEFVASPAVKRAYAPTWPHVLGAVGLSLGLLLAPALSLLTLSRNIEADLVGMVRQGLVYALIFYIAWPAIVVKWRRMRVRFPRSGSSRQSGL